MNGTFISPVYDSLETNIPNSMMQFTECPFPTGTALFPTHVVVKDYLHQYAEELKPLIRLQSLILDVVLSKKHQNPEWTVTWRDLKTGGTLVEQFDAVVVANGHHNDPYIPEIPGLAEWNRAYPGSIIHSSSYRRPESFANKVCHPPPTKNPMYSDSNRKLLSLVTPPRESTSLLKLVVCQNIRC